VTLEQTYKPIFTSPLSIKTMPKDDSLSHLPCLQLETRTTQSKKLSSKLKRNVAAIIGLRTVTPRSITYAAVQASLVYLMPTPLIPSYF
jgi:hypothetical protein